MLAELQSFLKVLEKKICVLGSSYSQRLSALFASFFPSILKASSIESANLSLTLTPLLKGNMITLGPIVYPKDNLPIISESANLQI